MNNKKTNRGFTLIELLIVMAIVAILGCMVVGAVGGCSVSDGTRNGTLSKFSNKGLFIKSYEGELVQGGLRQVGNTTAANVWSFSCLDKSLVPALQSAADNGNQVSLKYKQTFFRNPFIRNTSYLIVGVNLITNR